MSFLTIFKVSLRSLGRNPIRSFLSCLGIGIGIVAVILAMAIGEGAKTMMVKEISSMGNNLMMVFPERRNRGPVSGGMGQGQTMTAEDAEAIKRELGHLVKSVSPQVRTTVQMMYGAKNWTIPLWKRFYVCLAVVNLGIGSFLFAKHLWVIMVIYLIIGVCQSPTWINGNQLMLHLVPQTRFTEGMAWMGAMNAIGGSAGSAIAGVFIDRNGSHGGFMVVTALALVSLAIALLGFKQIKTSTETPVLTEISA